MASISHSSLAGHVLIVDSTPADLTALGAVLRSAGFRLSLAFDGVQGYERSIANQPDLIMLDSALPRLDGLALCRRLKSHHLTSAIPVIFFSGDDSPAERVKALRAGAVDYILKSCSLQEVLVRIQIHIQLARAAAPAGAPDASGPQAAPAAQQGDEDSALILAVQRYLADHLGEDHTLKHLAGVVGVRERRLTVAFRKRLNMSVYEYLRKQRMETAKYLLRHTALRIVSIGEEMGFSSAANFSTAFRNYTGVAPSAYRRQAWADGRSAGAVADGD